MDPEAPEAPTSPTDIIGAVLDGRYRVIEAIAEGAMGVVYRAERVKLGRIVAIKLMHESLPAELSSRQRFEIEAMAMAKLEHPHCAAVLDVGIHNERPYVVMDFVSGDNLKDIIEQRRLPIVRIVEIMRQVLSGLAHAHELGIVHRDIKPANIVLSQKAGLGDHVKILDFGLARLHDTKSPALTVGLVVGTPSYMAPEQCIGQTVDARTDLYACGILLFELLTGKKPFVSKNDDPVEVVRMHIQDRPPTLAEATNQEFGPELETIVARALAKRPDDRYANAGEFAAELDVIRARLFSAPIALPVLQTPVPSGPTGWTMNLPSSALEAVADHSSGHANGRSRVLPTGEDTVRDPSGGTPNDSLRVPLASTGVPSNSFGSMPSAPYAQPVAYTPPPHASAPMRLATEGLRMDFPPVPAAPMRPARPIAWLPLDRRQLAIAGAAAGGLLLVIIIIIGASSGGGGGPAKIVAIDGGVGATPGDAIDEIQMPNDPESELVTRATDLLNANKQSAALDLLEKGRAVFPNNPTIAFLTGRVHFARLFWNAGIKAFRDAIRLDPHYKSDPELIKTVLRGFITTPSYNGDLASFLRNDIGPPAEAFLQEAAASHPNAGIRARAAAELRRYR